MKNRYKNILQKYNQQILELSVYNPHLFYVGAFEINKVYRKGNRVLEIGCGEGDSTEPILERTQASIDLLDISRQMIDSCKDRLKKYASRTKYIQADALNYLKTAEPYDIIISAWTIHNFTQADKRRLFSEIYKNLKPGGMFMLMDKVYPGGNIPALLSKQLRRYRYLPLPVLRAITQHEKTDASSMYRMDEKPLLALLRKIGFKKLSVEDRVERYIVLKARK